MNIPAPCLVKRTVALFEKIPYSLIAFIARFSIAAVFWKSGQTKVEGFAIDLISGTSNGVSPNLPPRPCFYFAANTNCLCCRPRWPRTWQPLPSTFFRY